MNTTTPSKEEIKAKRKMLSESNRKHTSALVEVPKSEWPKGHEEIEGTPIEMYRSNQFLVMIFEENNCHRITVSRTAINSDGSYKDGITWDELQDIKRWVGFGDKDAIEIYPNDRDVVNFANMRHLWVMPSPIGCAWRNTKPDFKEDLTIAGKIRGARRKYTESTGKEPIAMKLQSKIYHLLRGELNVAQVQHFDGMEVHEVEELQDNAEIAFLVEDQPSNVIPLDQFTK